MSSYTLLFFAALLPISFAHAKCMPEDRRTYLVARKINEKALPPGVEVVDRVWIKNTSSNELITFDVEAGALLRTDYRTILGAVPTTKDELPTTKLVNGERYTYHFPENPSYPDGEGTAPKRGGWVLQAYPAALIEPKAPTLTPGYENKLVSKKVDSIDLRVPVGIYFAGKRKSVDFIFTYTRNPNFGVKDSKCVE